MKTHTKNLVIFFSLFFFINIPLRAELAMWPVIKIGKNIVTSFEVERYIDAVVLNPEIHAELFKKSNNDFSVYEFHKKKLADEFFKDSVDQIAAIRVLEAQAIRAGGRNFFSISKNQMANMVKENIRLALSPFQKTSLGQDEVKRNFVESLVKKGFPYKLNANVNDIYLSWEGHLKTQVKEAYRQKEAIRYLCSLGDCQLYGVAGVFNKFRKYLDNYNYLELDYDNGKKVKGSDAFKLLFVNEKNSQTNLNQEKNSDEQSVVFYLGKIVGEKVEFVHINDWNLLGSLGTKLGYPDTDDQGRTSGLLFKYKAEGTLGTISVELQNWLFSKEISKGESTAYQHIEEETSMRIVSRQFLDEKGQKWVVVGISATNRSQHAGFGSWVQENFHKLNPSNHEKINVDRDASESFAQAIFGFGGKYSIIDHEHVDLVLSGEGVLLPTAGQFNENAISLNSAIEMNVYRKRDDLPIFQIAAFANYLFRVNGSIDSSIGVKATIAYHIKRVRLEVGLFVIRWNGEMDRMYEGSASWTTGILLSFLIGPKKSSLDYEFNI